MKKIFAFILVLTLALGLCACGGKGGELDAFEKAYQNSEPTMIKITTTEKIGETELHGYYNFKTGSVDGVRASVYSSNVEVLPEETEHLSGVKLVHEYREYVEGRGLRVDADSNSKATWDPSGADFAPSAGQIVAIKLEEKKLSDVKIDGNKLTFTVAAEQVAEVFGGKLNVNAPVSVTITTDGAVVVGITLSYTTSAGGSLGDCVTTISAEYFYDLQTIVLVG